jgi:hypothetical protein
MSSHPRLVLRQWMIWSASTVKSTSLFGEHMRAPCNRENRRGEQMIRRGHCRTSRFERPQDVHPRRLAMKGRGVDEVCGHKLSMRAGRGGERVPTRPIQLPGAMPGPGIEPHPAS